MYNVEHINNNFNAEKWLNESYGCEFYMGNNGWLTASCPFSDHQDTSPSFGINPENGCFNCFGCSRKGSYIDLVMGLLEINFLKAIRYMSIYSGYDLDDIDLEEYKINKFKKAFLEEDNIKEKNKRNIIKTILRIKSIMKSDFEKGDLLYKKMDEFIKQEEYNKLEEIFNE